MILTGENWSVGRKTLYSVGGRWMDEYGAMVEWYWQGKPEVLGEKHLPVPLCSNQIWNTLSCDRTRPSTMKFRRMTARTISLPPFSARSFSKTARVTTSLTMNTRLPHLNSQEVLSPWKFNAFTARVVSSGQCGHRAVSGRYSRQHCSGVRAAAARCLSHSRTF